ncbi:hypothetical protein ES703_57439 [subsurface metagenome]
MKGTNRFLISLICAVVGVALSACGLEKMTNLSPPKFGAFSSPDKTFTFRKTPENGDNTDPDEQFFRGFELYYKIYTQLQETDKNITDFDLLSKKFHRVSPQNVKPKPLIPVPIDERNGTNFDIVVNFSGLTDSNVEVIYLGLDFNIRRGVSYTETEFLDEYKHFDYSIPSAFTSGDADVTTDVWTDIENSESVVLVLYALSYGKKDFIYDVYSMAVYLGEIDIRF